MPRSSCAPCCNPAEMARSTPSFRSSLLLILCELLAASGPSALNLYSWNTFCDLDEEIVLVRTVRDAAGDVIGSDGFYLNGDQYGGSLDDLRLCG